MAIWEQSYDHFCDDITLWQLERLNCPATLENPQYDHGQYLIQQQLQFINIQLAHFVLPPIIHNMVNNERLPWTVDIRNFNSNDED